MNVVLNVTAGESLEHHRPVGDVEWLFVASGYWSQDVYHSGHIAYYLAKTAPDEWVMESVERDSESDDAGLDDVEVGSIDDGERESQSEPVEGDDWSFQRIVAVCWGAPLDARPEDIAGALYRLVCNAGGNAIDEPDDVDGLLTSH